MSSSIQDTKEALVELIDEIENKMKITPPGTDYYVDLERQLEELENQLLTLPDDELDLVSEEPEVDDREPEL